MFDGKYLDWNQKRIKAIIDFYGHKFFYYKKILDLGCGYADISGVLHRLGADITAADARQEHLKVAAKKYPGIKTVKADFDRGWPFAGKIFDIALNLDLMTHLGNFEPHLRAVCSSCTHLILECAVCDSDDPSCVVISSENKNIYDLSINGNTSHPSSATIERILTECGMNFKRIDHPKLNSGSYTYDWNPLNNNSVDLNKRRFWFAVKNNSPIQFSNKESKSYDLQQIVPQNLPATVGSVQVLSDTGIHVSQAHILNPPQRISYTSHNQKLPRVAVCLSGHLRTFERTHKSLKDNLIAPLNADVFIHTWEMLGSENSKAGADQLSSSATTKSKISLIREFYDPKKINIETFDKNYFMNLGNKVNILDSDRMYVVNHLGYHFAMFYSIKKANDLKSEFEIENGFKYDYVIRFRPDLYLETKINQSFFPSHKNSIVTPMIAQYHSDGMNDQIAIGSSENMDTYSLIFNNKLQYCQSRVCSIRPESLLRYHCTKHGLVIEKKNIQYLIIRVNGQILKQT